MGFLATRQKLIRELTGQVKDFYGDRLVSFAVFGSSVRAPRPDSDVDVLIVARQLPRGRVPRARQFAQNVEAALEPVLARVRAQGIPTFISPVFKTPEEVLLGSPLFLDMTVHVNILVDREDFLQKYLRALKFRLRKLGSRRVVRGNAWYWILKPDYREGDVIRL